MTDETPEDTGKPAPKKTAQAESERAREVRQAAALRENLHKRNAQRRERKSVAPDSGPVADDD
jgi:hypothetical protein